ncbi:MAG: RHS repeat-associated core domain-containing protein [Planctomycetia bacterium]
MAQHIRRFGPLALFIALLGGLVGAIAPHLRQAVAAPTPATPLPIVEASAPPSEDVCPAEMEAEGIYPCAGPCYCDPPPREPTDPSPPPPPPTTGTPTTPPGGVTTPSGGHGGPVITPRWNTSSGSVNAYTGEFHWAVPLPTYHVPGPRFGTGFWLVYRSQAYIDGVTGNWDVTFNQRLVDLPSGDIACFTGTARTGDLFSKSGSVWYAPDGWPCELVKLAGFGSTGNSFRMVEASGTYREYDPDGFLVLMGDPSGNTLQFSRNSSAPNEVTAITDDTGRSSTLAYTNGRLTSFTDPTGAVTTLAYHSTTGWLTSVTTPSVTFKDGAGSTVTRGIVTSFIYSSGFGTAYRNGNLIEILDDSNVVQIENTYDSSDRVQTQENALGGAWQFSYFGTTTDVFHPSGYKKRLTFDADGRTVQSEEFTASGMGGSALRTGEPSSYVTTIVRHTGCSCGAPQSITLPDGTVWAYTRNSLGQPTQLTVTPGSGVAGGSRTWSWTYGAPYSPTFARLLTETDPLGKTRTLAYDSLGRLTSLTEPTVTLGVPSSQVAQTTYTRTSQGLISQITRPSGLVVTFSYQSSTGYLLSMSEDPSGLAVTRSWTVDSAGRRLTDTDPMGAVRTRTYNALGRMTQEAEPTGGSGTTLLYDFRGSLVRLDRENRDASGTLDSSNPAWTTTWTYDAGAMEATRSDEVTSGVFVTTTSDWTPWGAIAQVLSPEGRETILTYDERNLVHQVTQAPGTSIAGTQTRDYDLVGQLVRLTDPLSRAWNYVTDAYGAMIRSTDPLGIKAEGVFDAAGRLSEALVKDASNVTVARTIYTRDERGRVYQESQILLNSSGAPTGTTSDVVTLWSAGDEVLERTDPTGRKGTATYDALSRLDVATSPGGDTVDVTYDQASRVTLLRHTDLVPGGSPFVWQERHTFDTLGRRTAYARESASSTALETRAWDHDGLGAVVETTDGVGNRVEFAYDGVGRNVSVTRELRSGGTGSGSLVGTATTSTSYDDDGIVLTQTDDNSRVTSYTHDARGRRTGTTLSDSSAWTYTFDLASQMTGWTDPNGTVVTQTRDSLGRVTARSITPATGVLGPTSETYTWDALGRLVGATDNDSTVSRAFDSLGRMLSETAGGASPPGSPTTQFTQDLAGRLTGLTYPDATAISRTYDSDGRLNLVQAGGSTLVDLDWSGSRISRRTLGGGTVRGVATFDGIGRVTRLAWTQQPSATAIRTLDYLWDAAGRLRYQARADLSGQGDVYAYDSLARVVDTRFQVPNPAAEVATPGSQTWTSSHAYALDGVQNRASDTKTLWGQTPVVTSYTSDTRNRYTAVGAGSRTYSANGELLSDGTRTYAYDYRSRLVEVRVAGPGTLVATYGWDPLDRRDRRTVAGGVDERHYFAGHDLVAVHELSGGGFRRVNLVHGGSGIGPAVAWVRDEGDANGNSNTSETIQVLCGQNYAGSLVFAADASGAELEGYTYDDFGAVSTWTPGGAPRTAALLALPSRFQGMAYDPENALHLAGRRQYDAAVGRWLQADPLGTWGDGRGLGAESQGFAHAATVFGDPFGLFVASIGGAGPASQNKPIEDAATGLAGAVNAPGESAYFFDTNGKDGGEGLDALSRSNQVSPKLANLIEAKVKADPCQPVTLIAHSWGVNNAMHVARILKDKEICIDEIIVLDAVRQGNSLLEAFENPGNVTRITNIKATGRDPDGWGNAISDVLGSKRVTGKREADARSPSCINPEHIDNTQVEDSTVGHGTVGSGAEALKAFEAAKTRWSKARTAGQTANCCGKCK